MVERLVSKPSYCCLTPAVRTWRWTLLINQRALSERSELVRSPKVGVRPILMRPDGASLVLATFAETKVARLPGRNPAFPSTKIKPRYIKEIDILNKRNTSIAELKVCRIAKPVQ